MAIQVNGTQVIGNSRELTNIASVDATTVATLNAGGVGGGGFEATTVSGNSPTLNVGSFNFFDGGQPAGVGTLAFSNIPSGASRWQYSYLVGPLASKAYKVSAPWVEQPVTNSLSGTFRATFGDPTSGSVFYARKSNGDIYKYNLSVPFQISTIDGGTLVKSTSGYNVNGEGDMIMSADGNKIILAVNSSTIYSFNLSTPYDVSTMSSTPNATIASTGTGSSWGVAFNRDGTKFYYSGSGGPGARIYQTALSTAYDISTATGTRTNTSQDTDSRNIAWSIDGLSLIAQTGTQTAEYTCTTAFDVTTAPVTSAPSAQIFPTNANSSLGQTYLGDGVSAVWGTGSTADPTLLGYDVAPGIAPNLPASVAGSAGITSPGTRSTIDFYTLNGGTNVSIVSVSSSPGS